MRSVWWHMTWPSSSSIKDDSGPLLCVAVPWSHFLLLGKPQTKTGSPMVKSQLLACRPWSSFCFCCLLETLWRSDKWEHSCLPMRSSAGETVVVVYGVLLYLKRIINEIFLDFNNPVLLFFKLSLSICMARSGRPLLAGWYGADLTCFMPLSSMNVSESSLVELFYYLRQRHLGLREWETFLSDFRWWNGGCGWSHHSYVHQATYSGHQQQQQHLLVVVDNNAWHLYHYWW